MPALINPFFLSPLSITYLGAIEYASGASISGPVDIGVADTRKEIFVVMSVTYPAERTLDSGSVAGQAVTKFTTDFASTSAKQIGCFVSLPTQAGSQTVTLTFAGGFDADQLGSGVAFVYKVLNRSNTSAQHTDADGDSGDNYGGGTNTSITLDATTIPAAGFWLATGIENNQNTVTWNNGSLDEEVDNLLNNRSWGAHRDPGASSTPSDQFSWTGDNFCSGASWAFAA